MTMRRLPYDQILQGDSLDILKEFPENSVDVVFADPPYNCSFEANCGAQTTHLLMQWMIHGTNLKLFRHTIRSVKAG